MSSKKDELRGNRRSRKTGRKEELQRIVVITDAEKTEKNYFKGLIRNLPPEMRKKIHLEVISEVKVKDLIVVAKEKASKGAYAEIWIVFDKDLVEVSLFNSTANYNGEIIKIGWSNPCIELWFLSYFNKFPVCSSPDDCVSKFGNVYKQNSNKDYEKNDENIYEFLKKYGDEEVAIRIAENKHKEWKVECKNPSDCNPSTTLFELLKIIRSK